MVEMAADGHDHVSILAAPSTQQMGMGPHIYITWHFQGGFVSPFSSKSF